MSPSPRHPGPPRLVLRFLLVLVCLAGGCSFDRNWKRLAAAESQPATSAPADPLAGRWEGTWRSDRNGHNGKLRAIVTPAGGSDSTYRADFDATYLGVLRFGYSMDLVADGQAGATQFKGEENLGWLAGGVYQYDGTTDGVSFDCTYKAKSDHGTFSMTRPTP